MGPTELLFFLLFWGLLWGVVCTLIAQRKNKPASAFWWGFFLGLIGVLIVAVSSPGRPPAPLGLMSVTCTRCNAVQNIPMGAKNFECWQCHLKTAAPAAVTAARPPKVPVTCPSCKAKLTATMMPDRPTFKCPKCGARGHMPLLAS